MMKKLNKNIIIFSTKYCTTIVPTSNYVNNNISKKVENLAYYPPCTIYDIIINDLGTPVINEWTTK